jgi:hypothetical protein
MEPGSSVKRLQTLWKGEKHGKRNEADLVTVDYKQTQAWGSGLTAKISHLHRNLSERISNSGLLRIRQ